MADASSLTLERLRGRFIVFEGPDGSGKTTQLRRFLRELNDADLTVCEVREPGGTAIGEQIRRLLLDPAFQDQVDVRCEMLLFMASRAQLVAERIAPARERGELIVADRFIASTLAYQGTAGGLPVEDILHVGKVALDQHWPELTLVFDVDERTAATRMNPLLRDSEFEGAGHDRIEIRGAEFHRRVRRGYLEQAQRFPDHYQVIDATADEQSVYDAMLEAIERHFASRRAKPNGER